MKKIDIGGQVTLDGRTYLPGQYRVIGNNIEAGADEVNETQSLALIANHPVLVKEHKPKPPSKPKAKAESKVTGATKPKRRSTGV